MQTADRVLAGRYAKALFEAADAAGEADRLLKDLKELERFCWDGQAWLRNPRLPAAEKKRRAGAALAGKASARTVRFAEFLIEKKRLELVPLFSLNVGRLVAERKNLARAQVRCARALTADEQARLRRALEGFSGKSVELEVREDPDLLGGAVVRLGDWVLDGSLRGQLGRLVKDLAAA
jgi:F-type H+-transporting ATPase subunit delta